MQRFWRWSAIALAFLVFQHPAHAQIITLPQWQNSQWYRNCASLDLDFVHDRYYINSNTSCDGTVGTQYSAGGGSTGVQNFITGVGATFSRNSIGTYFDNTGTLQSASANVPRLDHSPVSPYAPLGILIEENRTNLLTQSNYFSSWSNGSNGTSLTANAATSPDGTTDAAQLNSSTSLVTQQIYTGFSGAASTTYTLSLFAKNVTGSSYHQVGIGLGNTAFGPGSSTYYEIVGELNNCTLANNSAGVYTSVAYSSQSLSNGWCKFSVSGTSLSSPGANYAAQIVIYNGGNSFTGDGTGIYIYGAQVEAGSFPTSYISTSGSAVTRATDVFYVPITGAGTFTGAWYNSGASTGTLLANGIYDQLGTTAIYPGLADLYSPSGNSVDLYMNVNGNKTAAIYAGGTIEFAGETSPNYVAGNVIKQAVAFAAGSANSANDGVLSTAGSPASIPTIARLDVGADVASQQGTKHVQRITYFPNRQPDASLPDYTR